MRRPPGGLTLGVTAALFVIAEVSHTVAWVAAGHRLAVLPVTAAGALGLLSLMARRRAPWAARAGLAVSVAAHVLGAGLGAALGAGLALPTIACVAALAAADGFAFLERLEGAAAARGAAGVVRSHLTRTALLGGAATVLTLATALITARPGVPVLLGSILALAGAVALVTARARRRDGAARPGSPTESA